MEVSVCVFTLYVVQNKSFASRQKPLASALWESCDIGVLEGDSTVWEASNLKLSGPEMLCRLKFFSANSKTSLKAQTLILQQNDLPFQIPVVHFFHLARIKSRTHLCKDQGSVFHQSFRLNIVNITRGLWEKCYLSNRQLANRVENTITVFN